MNVFTSVFTTLLRRLAARKQETLILLVLLVAGVQFAVFLAQPAQETLRLGVVGASRADQSALKALPGLTLVDQEPGLASIALQRFDAVVDVSAGLASPKILHSRDQNLGPRVRSALGGRDRGEPDDGPGLAGTVLGLTLFFLFFLAQAGARFLAQDKEGGLLGRLVAAGARPGAYLAAVGAVTTLVCFVPLSLVVLVEGALRGDGLGLAAGPWLVLAGAASLMAAAFGVFMMSLFPDEDQASMATGMAVVFTSLLAGVFVDPGAQGPILSVLSRIFPQRAVLDLCQAFQNQGDPTASLVLLGCWVAGLSALTWAVLRKSFQQGVR